MKEDLDQNFQQLQLDVTPLPGWNIHLQGNMRITTNLLILTDKLFMPMTPMENLML